MGRDISQLFTAVGFEVVLIDLPEKMAGLRQQLVHNDNLSLIDSESLSQEAVDGAVLAIEAVSEDKGLKLKTIKKIISILPEDALIVSNTSTISINELAAATDRPESFAGMHFFNPANKMKLVEIIRGIKTSKVTLERLKEICRMINKKPIVLNDSPGFIVNRLLFAMLNEAFNLAFQEIADFREIDEAMKLGAGHPLGPFALADLIGLDTCYAILSSLENELQNDKYHPSPLLTNKIDRGELGRKTKKGFYEYTN